MDGDLPFPVVRTKLHRPQVADDLVRRDGGLASFDLDSQVSLLLVSAPGGYGKSTWVSQWIEQQEKLNCWLSLDSHDNDFSRFLTYLVASVRTVLPSFGSVLLRMIGSQMSNNVSDLAGAFCNEMDESGASLAIVLDNYDLIDNQHIHTFVDQILEFPPPGLLLVIVTRHNPPLTLSIMRARNLVREVRLRDLKLSTQGSISILSSATQGRLTSDAAEQLAEMLEGWPAGLRFASLALANHTDPNELFARFDGKLPKIKSYFGSEILLGQPPEVRERLLFVSILDSFCAPLCEHLWQALSSEHEASSDFSGEEFVEHLRQNGIFCIDLDEHEQWFRFHHLFQDMLQQQLAKQYGAEKISALHRCASAWYEAEGMIDNALEHAKQAGGVDEFAPLIARQYPELLDSEQWTWIESWLSQVPEEVLGRLPELTVLKAFYLQNRGTGLDADSWEWLDKSEQLLAQGVATSIDVHEIQATIDTIRASLLAIRGDVKDAVRYAQQGLDSLSDEYAAVRSFALIVLVIALCATRQSKEASDAINKFLSENSAPTSNPILRARTLVALGFFHWWAGSLEELKLTGNKIRKEGETLSLAESVCMGAYFEGNALYDQNQLTEAVQCLTPIVTSENVYNALFYLRCGFLLANAQNGLGRNEEAQETASRLVQRMQFVGNNPLLADAQAFQADLSMRQGLLVQAGKWAQSYEPRKILHYCFYSAELTWLKYMAQTSAAAGISKINQRMETYEQWLRETAAAPALVEFLLFKALHLDDQDDHKGSDRAMSEALELALPGGMVRPFIDLGAQISIVLNRQKSSKEFLDFSRAVLDGLRAHGQIQNGADQVVAQAALDPLSRRELEILGLLAERLSNQEIADQLYISVKTVKRHAANIYQKLGVQGRREAVLQASRQGILRA